MKGLLAYASLAAFLAVVGCSPRSVAPDPMALLRKNRDAMFALKAYRADCFTDRSYDPPRPGHVFEIASLTAEKPLRMRYDGWRGKTLAAVTTAVRTKSTPEITFASNGSLEYLQFGRTYRVELHVMPERLGTLLEPWEGFFASNSSVVGMIEQRRAGGERVDVSYAGTGTVEGVACNTVRVHTISVYGGTKQDQTATYFIGAEDNLVHRDLSHITFDGKSGFTSDAVLRNIDTHPKVALSVYRYAPPGGVIRESAIVRPKLLAVGANAPDFSAIDAEKHPLKLSDFRGTVVVVDFWASWCGPCVESMPHTQDVAKSLSDAGVRAVVLAIDDGEPQGSFASWVADKASKFPNLRFAYADPRKLVSSKLYRVSGIPTQFVIDKQGVIRKSFVGYGGPTDDLKDAVIAANGS